MQASISAAGLRGEIASQPVAGVATGPRGKIRKPKAGRPRIEDRDKTLAAQKPWKAAGMSRSSWYRRQPKIGAK